VKKNVNLFYLANPPFGGWVTFTAHLAHCLKEKWNVRLYRAAKTVRTKDFGYGISCATCQPSAFSSAENVVITAIDKHHYDCLHYFKGGVLVIHDPTELKKELLSTIRKFRIVTIRKTVKELLEKEYGIESTYLPHPFFQYQIPSTPACRIGSVSISRIDFDKHTDIILKANANCENPVSIYGAANGMYVHFKLAGLSFEKHYKGRFIKSFDSVSRVLSSARYMVDMSAINKDGGGTQYTFLEAIHCGCALVLNKKWFFGQVCADELEPGENCFIAGDENELLSIIKDQESNLDAVVLKSKAILQNHSEKIANDIFNGIYGS
jgi:hypothetical protein